MNLAIGYAIAVGAIVVLVYFVPLYPGIVRGSLGHGTPGTFVAEREDCGKTCNWYGTYTSDDGTIVRKVHASHGTKQVGDTAREIYSGDSGVVYPPEGTFDWLWAGIIITLAIGYVTLMVWVTGMLINFKGH